MAATLDFTVIDVTGIKIAKNDPFRDKLKARTPFSKKREKTEFGLVDDYSWIAIKMERRSISFVCK